MSQTWRGFKAVKAFSGVAHTGPHEPLGGSNPALRYSPLLHHSITPLGFGLPLFQAASAPRPRREPRS